MTAKSIKAGMTQGEWVALATEVTQYTTNNGNPIIAICESLETVNTDISNAEAIVTAVNSTYGQNINPEAVPDMVKMLEGVIALSDLWLYPAGVAPEHEGEASALGKMYQDIQALLTSAKI